MSSQRLLVMGYLSIDTVTQADGASRIVPGGAGLYAALGAARAGAQVDLCASIGTDFPAAWIAALEAAGVGTSQLARQEYPSRRAHIDHAADGRRGSRHYDDPAWWEASRRHAPAPPDDLSAYRVAVACPMPAKSLGDFLARADRSGVAVVADTNEIFASTEGEAILEMLPFLDVFAPSREETRLLAPGMSDDAAARDLAARGRAGTEGPVVIQKRGAEGLFIIDGRGIGEWYLPALTADVVDPTGAGDATVGAFAAARMQGAPPLEAGRTAQRIGTLVVSGHGPSALCAALPPLSSSCAGQGVLVR
ncbi:sugar/nucleoside kinase (ribokinase family) [Angulomicrobium tetraedrale]|uniref:Sugar/nucleoside kinase (Ribokinase family) n=1 Tax=Ancylobacter tetraedralis TaxID=217068 RepID=A0A839Z431_9HYPH|nr:carbohydrate kinase family protein [Ancylobacter tetraedralis]MBB3770382.1 sugar/nucleoside kinase (ribokinase family) [Ancylobacter tetraedralis]